MSESFINKIRPDRDGLDFEGLREDGINIAQKMSGDIWTDYNLHDPGVTVLEALCYALTDLTYRTGFGAADYLASSDGSIDYKNQALYRPDEILPCHPTTDNDYRKLIVSAVPNIDNVWMQRHDTQPGCPQGLCHLYVQLSEKVKNQANEGVRSAYAGLVEKVYTAHRNLCEDLTGVTIVERIPYTLRGNIEVDGKREPAHILAEIYFECAQYLSPKVPIHSYAEMEKNGCTTEDIFTGVLTGNGYIADAELYPWRGNFSTSDLLGKVARIKGVKNINHLIFVNSAGKETESINLGVEHTYRSVVCLSFPPQDSEGGIKLSKAGKAYPVLQRNVEPELNRLDYKYQAQRQQKARYDWVNAMLPVGNFRSTREYYSMQNHFPDIYGLNAYGIPDSAPPERKAQASQLKAYLLFFEQIMANFLQNMQEIPRFFSLDERLKQSYFYQVLRNDTVPNIEGVYLNGVATMDSSLSRLVAGFDNYGDRRNRVLDYLLGIYGERFSQNSLHHFFPEGVDSEEERIGNKIAYLRNIVDISRNRAAAFDYRKPAVAQNTSGLKKKLELLLGLRQKEHSSLPDASGGHDQSGELQLVEHILLRPSNGSPPARETTPDDFYSFRISIIFPADTAPFSSPEFRSLAEETVYMNCPAHIHPDIFWMDHERLAQFNELHKKWLTSKRSVRPQPEMIQQVAGPLVRFLRGIDK